jgi:hypothetical protein
VKGHLFIAPGDLTQLSADAIAYSASNSLGRDGNLYSAFASNVPGFADWYDLQRPRHGQLREVGDTFWMPLDQGRKPHGVVTVVSTGGGQTSEDKAALAVRVALTTALRELRSVSSESDHLLIALPTFRMGKRGDRRQWLRSARAQIAAARVFLAQNDGVDVAFIAYTIPLYQIFLEARREVREGATVIPHHYPDLEKALLARECVVFVGAGLSSGAGLPDWNSLLRRLGDDLGLPWSDRHDYLDLAQWYRERFGRERLAGLLREMYATPALPTLAHYLLMSLPLRHVITTNFDDLLERALMGLKQHPVKVLHQEDVARTGQNEVFVVKLHGDIAHPEEIVLTRDDYEEFFQRRPAMALLLEGLLLNQTFFFVGYGLRDPNFRQIHGRIVRMLREEHRPAFATTFEASGGSGPYLVEQWRNKQINLISVPGSSRTEQTHALLCFLDELADLMALHKPQLFLAPEVEVSPDLTRLRQLLIEEVGAEMEAFPRRCRSEPIGRQEVRYLAEVLDFLTGHGWRPSPSSGLELCRLWEELAQAATSGEQRRLLLAALSTAEAFADVERIRHKLKEKD